MKYALMSITMQSELKTSVPTFLELIRARGQGFDKKDHVQHEDLKSSMKKKASHTKRRL
jgi:hypothetical protein